jgi:hypothetical protein
VDLSLDSLDWWSSSKDIPPNLNLVELKNIIYHATRYKEKVCFFPFVSSLSLLFFSPLCSSSPELDRANIVLALHPWLAWLLLCFFITDKEAPGRKKRKREDEELTCGARLAVI